MTKSWLIHYTVFFRGRRWQLSASRYIHGRRYREKNTKAVGVTYTVMLVPSLRASPSKIGTYDSGNRETAITVLTAVSRAQTL